MLRYRNTVDVEPSVESSSEKKVRYFLAFMFFIQTLMTTLPFMHHVNVENNTLEGTVSALNFIIQADGIASDNGFMALYGILLVFLPLTAFFFCLFDKRSRLKYLFSGLCSVICAVIITFTVGTSISIGAVLTLIVNVITLFMTSQGVQATSARIAGMKN